MGGWQAPRSAVRQAAFPRVDWRDLGRSGDDALLPSLKIGDRHSFSYVIPHGKTVPHLYPESPDWRAMPEVFATGYMVGLMEWACLDHLKPCFEEGEGSLGVFIETSHDAATPPGLKVTVTVEVDRIEGRRIGWRVEAHDGIEVIGRGRHERVVVRWDRFHEKVRAKSSA
jgi:fluoroacetyl-CoA thioesterase